VFGLFAAAVAVLFTTAFVVVVAAATIVVVAATVVVVTAADATVVVVTAADATVVVVTATVVLVELEDDDEEGDVAVTSYRATAKTGGPETLLLPATTIFESPCIATALAVSDELVPMSVVTMPSVSKVESSAPVGVYRKTAKSDELVPATIIFESL